MFNSASNNKHPNNNSPGATKSKEKEKRLILPMTKSQAMSGGSMHKRPWGSANFSTTPQAEATKCKQIAAPTTFVQADANTFRELVQKLTGVSEESEQKKLPITKPARCANRANGEGRSVHQDGGSADSGGSNKNAIEVGPRKSAFKLHERRQCLRKLEIKLGLTTLGHHPHPHPNTHRISGEILSPTLPALVPSPVTPLESDPFTSPYSSGYSPYSTPTSCNQSPSSTAFEEEKAMADRGFYLHSSPNSGPRRREPELLPLFPLHSPREPNS